VPLIESFVTAADKELESRFLRDGYVIRPVDDRSALDDMRRELVGIVCSYLKIAAPRDPGVFLNDIHKLVSVPDLNPLRLFVYRTVNETRWLRPTYFGLARGLIEGLVGNELAMQNRVNLSIQFPNDDSSLLDLHADVFGGETPFQVVEWLPLVDCHKTKSMFILPAPKTKEITPRLAGIGDGGMAEIYDMIQKDLIWLDVPYGTVLVFSPNCLHGNIVNNEADTRWSMNCRFTGLFTPYTGAEKKLGSFYLPVTTRPVSRVGMAYREPGGFKE
jgi:sporadic carbohydrate cluster 2OG-Fe(II) oxygenase